MLKNVCSNSTKNVPHGYVADFLQFSRVQTIVQTFLHVQILFLTKTGLNTLHFPFCKNAVVTSVLLETYIDSLFKCENRLM
jgi:hypothetical protein